jgi:hypothetical protein
MRPHRALLFLPLAWHVALAPFANAVDWRPLGLSFQMVWQMAGVVVTTLVLGLVHHLDSRAELPLSGAPGETR